MSFLYIGESQRRDKKVSRSSHREWISGRLIKVYLPVHRGRSSKQTHLKFNICD